MPDLQRQKGVRWRQPRALTQNWTLRLTSAACLKGRIIWRQRTRKTKLRITTRLLCISSTLKRTYAPRKAARCHSYRPPIDHVVRVSDERARSGLLIGKSETGHTATAPNELSGPSNKRQSFGLGDGISTVNRGVPPLHLDRDGVEWRDRSSRKLWAIKHRSIDESPSHKIVLRCLTTR